KLVSSHRVRPAVYENKQRVFLVLVKVGRQGDEAVNPFAAFAGEPKMAQGLPCNLRDPFSIEIAERSLGARRKINSHNLGRTDCNLLVDKDHGGGRGGGVG